MIGLIIGLSILTIAVIILIVVLIVRNKEEQSTYVKKGVQGKKVFEFTFSGLRDFNTVYVSQTITVYEDCIIISKDNGSIISYDRIKLVDLDQCVFEIFSGIKKNDPPALCISLISYTAVEQAFKTVNETKWKKGSTNKVYILFRFENSEKVLYERELKAINEAVMQAIDKVRDSEEYINEQKSYEIINESIFMKQFINSFGCSLDSYKRRLVLVSGYNELAHNQMAMVYDKTNQRIAICEFKERAKDLKSAISSLSPEEKLLFVSKAELEAFDDYLELIKIASFDKFKSLFLSVDNIEIEPSSDYVPIKKLNSEFSLAAQSEFIHAIDDEEKQKRKSSNDNSLYLINISNHRYSKMYIDKMYFNETFSKHYSFLKEHLKDNKSAQ